MSEDRIKDYARELAAKCYNNRATEYPDTIPSEMEQENVKKSLNDLSTFIKKCRSAGKKVVLSIEFGICTFELDRFHQITNHLIKKEFEEYDPEALYVILGIDSEFTNEKMLRTLNELIRNSLPEGTKLINKESLRTNLRGFQVTPLPGEETDVSKGNANLYFFEVEETDSHTGRWKNEGFGEEESSTEMSQRYELGSWSNEGFGEEESRSNRSRIGSSRNEGFRNNFLRELTKKLSFYTYFIKHHIETSHFNGCEDAVRYYKAQQSETILEHSRNSTPRLPFWKALYTLCLHSISKIYYSNIAHFDERGPSYSKDLRKGYVTGGRGAGLMRINKYSEKMSEIWYILFRVFDRNSIPILLIDIGVGEGNQTFEGPSERIVELEPELAFKKKDEYPRIALTRNEYASSDDFVSSLSSSRVQFDVVTPALIESIDWDSICPDPRNNFQEGGKRARKSKRGSTKTKSRSKKQRTRKAK